MWPASPCKTAWRSIPVTDARRGVFVYLDESGDTGFKFPGSSRYFIIALVLTDDPIPLHEAVDELRESLGFSPKNEFKFYNSSEYVRQAFMEMLMHQNFSARVLVVDKHLMTQPHMHKRETFYNYLVRLVLTYDNDSILNATLILDESIKGEKSKQHFATYLRRSLNTDQAKRKIRDVKYHRSHSDNVIQVADMISGAVYAKYSRGEARYSEMIKGKIQDIWEWRPKQA
jgi:hypothetical protein